MDTVTNFSEVHPGLTPNPNREFVPRKLLNHIHFQGQSHHNAQNLILAGTGDINTHDRFQLPRY